MRLSKTDREAVQALFAKFDARLELDERARELRIKNAEIVRKANIYGSGSLGVGAARLRDPTAPDASGPATDQPAAVTTTARVETI